MSCRGGLKCVQNVRCDVVKTLYKLIEPSPVMIKRPALLFLMIMLVFIYRVDAQQYCNSFQDCNYASCQADFYGCRGVEGGYYIRGYIGLNLEPSIASNYCTKYAGGYVYCPDRPCTSCAPGKYCVKSACVACLPGFYCDGNSTLAVPCGPQSYSGGSQSACTVCPPA